MYRWVFYPLVKGFLAVLLFLLGPVKVVGRERVPQKGGVLIVANHISDADPPVMGHAVPRTAHFMAKSELFSIQILGAVIKALQAFPVNRGAPDRAALRRTIELLQQGEAVVMFPEGEISETGELQPLLPGAALIIRTSGVPVMCAGVVGTTRIVPFKAVIPRPAFGGVYVRFGEPRQFAKDTSQDAILGWIEAEFRALTLTPVTAKR